ncbi:hypothetical protein Q3G72_025961 [Acer saccharum]|nr:hypothetical protein Q3G72_025961 [Acer saccharum]
MRILRRCPVGIQYLLPSRTVYLLPSRTVQLYTIQRPLTKSQQDTAGALAVGEQSQQDTAGTLAVGEQSQQDTVAIALDHPVDHRLQVGQPVRERKRYSLH